MKKNLLIIFLSLFCFSFLSAQLGQGGSNALIKSESGKITTHKLTIYPNPATNYIGLNDYNSEVQQILIFNVVGRKMKTFLVEEDAKYYISDLPKGMYLVQLLGKNNKTITTHRLSKR